MSDSVFAPPTSIERGGRVAFGTDERLWVQFYLRSRLNPYRSSQEGKPSYDAVDFVKIRQPAERDQLDIAVTEEHKQRWPKQWEAYQAKKRQIPDGTPVKLLFPNEPHITDLCVDLNIDTIEQLAQLSEHGINRLGMDGRKYVAKAQAALDRLEATKEVGRLTRELDEAREDARLAREALAQMGSRVDALEARLRQPDDETPMEMPRRRGRPPKQPEAAVEPSGEDWLRSTTPEHVVEG